MRTTLSKPSPMRSFSSKIRREIKAKLIDKYGPYCQLCILAGRTKKKARINLEIPNERNSWSVDHIIPVSRGGRNIISNMWPAHKGCNNARGNNDL